MSFYNGIRKSLKLKKCELIATIKRIKELPTNQPVDFVLTWVDDQDENWQNEKSKYSSAYSEGNGAERYRDWDLLKYWFRSVEKYAPWVRKIHFVTYGHYPDWLNVNHEKLKIVKHGDFIPKKYLPTFNINPIELNFHRIEGLSECFVYFNDDVFLNRNTRKEDFFNGDNPKYCCEAIPYKHYSKKEFFDYMLFNNIGLVNDYFDITRSMGKKPELWFGKCNKNALKYHRLSFRDNYLYGMVHPHLGSPMKKTTMEQVWKVYGKQLDEICKNRFRTPLDVQQQIFHLWDMLNGTFCPVDHNHFGIFYNDVKEQIETIRKDIWDDNSMMVCLNDSGDIDELEFENVRSEIDSILLNNYPNKSEYEL
ncbi:MAG: Stealth CR1 domain-containing protein [Eubacterium sp.]|nr:Stealth CR1 domain-containing protein [Eubacterium sp.]